MTASCSTAMFGWDDGNSSFAALMNRLLNNGSGVSGTTVASP